MRKVYPLKKEGVWLKGYDKSFEAYVSVAFIQNKIISPVHGYYPPSAMAKKIKAYAKKNGYKFEIL